MVHLRISRSWAVLAALMAVLFVGTYSITLRLAAQTQTKKAPTESSQTPVDVNSADAKTLETLPGVGPTMAQRIIAGRPYKSLDDLGKVRGMTKTRLNAIQNDVTFGPAGTASQATTPPSTATKSGAKSTSTTAPTPTGHAAGKLAPGEKININTASAEDLDRLPGIGPTRAQEIINYRTQNGNFKTIDDIQKVKGIKAGEFSKIKDYITVQ